MFAFFSADGKKERERKRARRREKNGKKTEQKMSDGSRWKKEEEEEEKKKCSASERTLVRTRAIEDVFLFALFFFCFSHVSLSLNTLRIIKMTRD